MSVCYFNSVTKLLSYKTIDIEIKIQEKQFKNYEMI